MKLYKEAGFPDGVINFIPGDPQSVTDVTLNHPEFSGLHFTGTQFSCFSNLFRLYFRIP
jgi:1-pyrroline-5-carboxylate dehydrogenase